jgi:hypothetical protein
MFSMSSPLELRLSQHLPLTFAERDALQWLERREQRFEAGETVVREGEETDKLHIPAVREIVADPPPAEQPHRLAQAEFVLALD